MNWGAGLTGGRLKAPDESRCHTAAKGGCRSRPAHAFAGAIADPLLIVNRIAAGAVPQMTLHL